MSSYRTDGFLVVAGLFTANEVDAVRDEVTAIARAHEKVPSNIVQLEPSVLAGQWIPESTELGIRKLFRMALHNRFFRELAFHERMVGMAHDLLGPDLKLMQSMLLMKPPGVGGVKVWHQDNAYFRLVPNKVLGFWVACDDTSADNGCMHVVPGSHRDGIRPHSGEGDAYGLTEQLAFDKTHAVPLRAGDALLFHGELLHGTPANTAWTRRRALQYHYVSGRCASVEGGPGSRRSAELRIAGRDYDRSV